MPYTRDQILPHLTHNREPRGELLIPGQEYLDHDIPEGFFRIQEFCLELGVSDDDLIPDLFETLQGVRYLLWAATGNFSLQERLAPESLRGDLLNVNAPESFERGALIEFPELQAVLKHELLNLPQGQAVITAIRKLSEYQNLFS